MKFGEEIERSIFSEWRAYYFDYGGIKKILKETWEQFPYKELFEHHEIFIENDPDPRYAFQFLIAAATFKRFNVHSTGGLLSPTSLSVSPGTPHLKSNTRPGTPHHTHTTSANSITTTPSHDQRYAHRDFLMAALERFFTIHSEYDEDVDDNHPFPANPTTPQIPPTPAVAGGGPFSSPPLPPSSSSAPPPLITTTGAASGDNNKTDAIATTTTTGAGNKEREPTERDNSNSSCGDGCVVLNNHQVGLLDAVADAITLNTDIRRHVQTTTSGDKSNKKSNKSKKKEAAAASQSKNIPKNLAVILEGESIDYNSTSNVVPGVAGATATTFAASHGRAAVGRYIIHSVLETRSSHTDDAAGSVFSPPQRHNSRNTRRGSVISASSGLSGGKEGAGDTTDCGTDDNNDVGGDVSGGDTVEPSSPIEEEDSRQVLLLTTVALPATMRTRREELRQQYENLTQRVNVNYHVSEGGDATPLHGQHEECYDLCVSIHPEMIETICGVLSNFTMNNKITDQQHPLPTDVGGDSKQEMAAMSTSSTAAFQPPPPSATTDSTVSTTTALSRRRSSYMSEALGNHNNNGWRMAVLPSRFLSGFARMESPYINVRAGSSGGGTGGGDGGDRHAPDYDPIHPPGEGTPHHHHSSSTTPATPSPHEDASFQLASTSIVNKLAFTETEFLTKQFEKKQGKGKVVKGRGDSGHVVDTIANMDFFLPDKKFQLYSGNPSIPFAIYVYQQFVSTSFREAIRSEIDKVSGFYISQSRLLTTSALVCVDVAKMWRELSGVERTQLNIAFRQIYLTLDVLQQFCDINYIAILKILKKIDKVTHQDSLDSYKDCVDGVIFKMGRNSRISALQAKIVESYAEFAADGNTKVAHLVLNTTKGNVGGVIAKNVGWTLPLLWGITLTLCVAISTELIEAGYPVLGPGSHHHDSLPNITNTTSIGIADLVLPHLDTIAENDGTYLALLPLTAIILPFLFSFNVMIWERFGINYAFILDLDPIYHFTGAELMRDSLCYIVVYLICIFAFLKDVNNVGVGKNVWVPNEGYQCMDTALSPDFPSYIPLYAIFPIWIIMYAVRAYYNYKLDNSRRPWLLFTVGRIFTAPFHVVKFSDFFLCNQFTSMDFFFEVQFYWCTFSPESVQEGVCEPGRSMKFLFLSLLPKFGRFVQCIRRYYDEDPRKRKPFPNLVNMGKYLCACINTIFSFATATTGYFHPAPNNPLDVDEYKYVREAMFGISIVIQIVTMLYQFLWDVTSDAGIWIDKNDGRGYQLRKDLVFGHFGYYVFFIVLDFSARSTWAFKRIVDAVASAGGPGSAAYIFKRYEWTFCLYACINLFRRTVWSLFRVENEHVNNTENYRATKLTPIPQRVLDWDSSTDNMAERFAKMKGVQSEEFPSIRGYNLTTLTRFFANLPEKEKVAILNSSPALLNDYASWHVMRFRNVMEDPDEPLFTGVKHEGKSRFFSELPEEVKALLLLGYLKGETMGGFKTRVTAEEVAAKKRAAAEVVPPPPAPALTPHQSTLDSSSTSPKQGGGDTSTTNK